MSKTLQGHRIKLKRKKRKEKQNNRIADSVSVICEENIFNYMYVILMYEVFRKKDKTAS